MKPFSLESVLKYRQRLMDLARNKFMEAQHQYNAIKLQLDERTREYTSLIEHLQKLQSSGIEIQEHIRYENRIEFLKSECNSLKKQLKKKQDIVVRERNYLLLKSKEHRVLEKLKERQNDSWHRYLDKKEAAMLDEIAVLYKDR